MVYHLRQQELVWWEKVKLHPCHNVAPRVLWKGLRREQGMTCLQKFTMGSPEAASSALCCTNGGQMPLVCHIKFQSDLLPQHLWQKCHKLIRLSEKAVLCLLLIPHYQCLCLFSTILMTIQTPITFFLFGHVLFQLRVLLYSFSPCLDATPAPIKLSGPFLVLAGDGANSPQLG